MMCDVTTHWRLNSMQSGILLLSLSCVQASNKLGTQWQAWCGARWMSQLVIALQAASGCHGPEWDPPPSATAAARQTAAMPVPRE